LKLFDKLIFVAKKNIYKSKLYLYYNIFDHLIFLFKIEIKYELNILNNIERHVCNSKLIYDIGSNIGQYALNLSKITKFNSRIICFEPDLKAYSFLNYNVNMNKLSNISTYNFGIGEFNAQLKYFCDTKTGSRKGSFIKDFVGNNYNGEHFTIEVKSLSSLFGSLGIPDFIKIDVEGYEIEILKGLNNYDINNVKFLIETRYSTKEFIYYYFKKLNFICLQVDDEIPFKINNIKDIPDFANLFFYRE
jgi:FkbM family methyltransferase